MSNALLSILLGSTMALEAAGQTSRFDWVKTAGTSGNQTVFNLLLDPQGAPVITGMSEGEFFFSDKKVGRPEVCSFVSRLTPTGEVDWFRLLSLVALPRMALDGDGNIYIAASLRGSFTDGAITVQSTSGFDVFVAKFSSSGDLLWARAEPVSGSEFLDSIALDASGNCYVVGVSNDVDDNSGQSSFLMKFRSDGTGTVPRLTWPLEIGSKYAWPRAVQVDGEGNCYVAGEFEGLIQFGGLSIGEDSPVSRGLFLVKFDSNLQSVWATHVAGTPSDTDVETYGFFRSLAVDAAGNCYAAGFLLGTHKFGATTVSPRGRWDAVVAKYSPAGELLWVRNSGGAGHDSVERLVVDARGHCYVVGYFQGEATFGAATLTTEGVQDMFVCEYDPYGRLVWLQQFGTLRSAYFVGGIAVAEGGGLYLGGGVVNDAILSEAQFISNHLQSDIFVGKMVVDEGGSTFLNPATTTFRVAFSEKKVVVSWAANAGSLELECTSTLGEAAAWEPVSGLQETEADRVLVRISPEPRTTFFRLKKAR